MRYNKFLMLGAGVLLSAIASSNVYAAVNCSISYYCYRSMTPGPAPAGQDVLVRRTTAANNRVAAAARRAQPQRPGATGTNARAPQQRVQLTPAQRQAEARRREQVQQRELAERRRRAAQQAQQRLAQQRQRRAAAQQAQQRRGSQRPAAQPAARTQPNANAATRQQQLIAAQRRAHQAEQQRLAQQRRAQQQRAAAARTAANRPAPRPVATSANQSCPVISKKIAELSRQAVLRSKEGQADQAQRLFKAVEQLKTEGKGKRCPGIV